MLGRDGSRDILVIKDALAGFKAAYPMPDKSTDSTMDTLKPFKGERTTGRL